MISQRGSFSRQNSSPLAPKTKRAKIPSEVHHAASGNEDGGYSVDFDAPHPVDGPGKLAYLLFGQRAFELLDLLSGTVIVPSNIPGRVRACFPSLQAAEAVLAECEGVEHTEPRPASSACLLADITDRDPAFIKDALLAVSRETGQKKVSLVLMGKLPSDKVKRAKYENILAEMKKMFPNANFDFAQMADKYWHLSCSDDMCPGSADLLVETNDAVSCTAICLLSSGMIRADAVFLAMDTSSAAVAAKHGLKGLKSKEVFELDRSKREVVWSKFKPRDAPKAVEEKGRPSPKFLANFNRSGCLCPLALKGKPHRRSACRDMRHVFPEEITNWADLRFSKHLTVHQIAYGFCARINNDMIWQRILREIDLAETERTFFATFFHPRVKDSADICFPHFFHGHCECSLGNGCTHPHWHVRLCMSGHKKPFICPYYEEGRCNLSSDDCEKQHLDHRDFTNWSTAQKKLLCVNDLARGPCFFGADCEYLHLKKALKQELAKHVVIARFIGSSNRGTKKYL